MQKNSCHCKRPCCKASKEVPTDKSLLERPNHTNHYRFIPESRVGAKLVDMYRNDTPAESFQHLELLNYQSIIEKNGTGRPTKDRRDIDEFGNK
jgi:ribosome-associated heat shock protein Hsp15